MCVCMDGTGIVSHASGNLLNLIDIRTQYLAHKTYVEQNKTQSNFYVAVVSYVHKFANALHIYLFSKLNWPWLELQSDIATLVRQNRYYTEK